MIKIMLQANILHRKTGCVTSPLCGHWTANPTSMKVSFDDTRTAFESKTDKELKLANFLFSIINNPLVASISQQAMSWGIKLRLPIDWIIRRTVFAHFCGGQDISSADQVVHRLGTGGVQTILDYSSEGTMR